MSKLFKDKSLAWALSLILSGMPVLPTQSQDNSVAVPLTVPEFARMPIGRHEPQLDIAGRKTLDQVKKLLEKNNYQGAVVELRQALKGDQSSNAALWYTLATLEIEQNQTTQAVNSLLNALKALPDFTRAQAMLAGIYSQQRDYKKARPLLQAALKREASAGLYGMLGYGYLMEKQYLSARGAYQQALIFDGNNASYLKGLLQATMALEEWAAASNVLEVLLSEQTTDAELLLVRASLAQRQGNDMAAINSLRLALGKTSGSRKDAIRWQLGQLYLKTGAFDSATDLLGSLAKAKTLPDSSDLIAALNYLLVKGQSTPVIKLASALQKHPQVDNALRSQLLMLVGRGELIRGRTSQARNAFARAADIDPLNGEAFIQQALLIKPANQQQAQVLLARAADLEGSKVRGLTLLAQVLLEEKAYDRALNALERAYGLAPDTHGLKENLDSVRRLAMLGRPE